MLRISLTVAALCLALATAAQAQAPAQTFAEPPAPKPETVAPGVWLIAGGIPPNRQPDGNTVVFETPQGLVVMDTGRHIWQRRAILDFAAARGKPVVAIVNSHWHLDHVSGNPDIKRAHTGAKVYASDAIDGALTGFLPKSAVEGRKMLEAKDLPPESLDDIRLDLATIDNPQALRPDVTVRASGLVDFGGRPMQVNLAADAATGGDVWVYDEASRVVAVGDLVTLPVPFLDTGCPQGWKAALAQVWATPFEIAVPGHGKPMSRTEFAAYRTAFEAFVDCANSTRDKGECSSGWIRDAGALLASPGKDPNRFKGFAESYVDMLRAGGGKSASCRTA